ncbi:EpsG family protein [Flavobacterium sp. UW10123]|uniref:EpsG family protein n=1 Tax=Flavobacterium sp. UW10123 TaxID=3230800 RepID=UPI003390F411
MDFFSLPYLFLILCYVFLYFYEKSAKESNNKVKAGFLGALLFVFFFGFRGFIGSDWFNYENYYSEATLDVWTAFDYEVGFSFLVKLFHDLGFQYSFFVFFITLIQTILWHRFLKRQSYNISLAYIVLISCFPLLIIDLLRNFTAILIAVQSIEYINKNQRIKAFLIILLSMSFHLTGFAFLFLFLLKRNYFNKKILIVLLFLGIIVYFLQIRFVDGIVAYLGGVLGGRFEYLAGTVTESDVSYGIRFGILEKIFLFILVLINYKHVVNNKLLSPIYFNSFFCYCFIQLFFSTSEAMINRFALLFFWAYLIVLCNLKNLIKNKEIRNNVVLPIVMFCVLKTYVTFNNPLYRYSNVIFSNESYYDRALIRDEFYESKD